MFNLHAMYVNPNASEKTFFLQEVEITGLDLSSIPMDDILKLKPDEVLKYNKLMLNPSTKYPIVSGDKLIDGLHRISAAKINGKKVIHALDFGKLINTKESGYQFKVKTNPLPKHSAPASPNTDSPSVTNQKLTTPVHQTKKRPAMKI